PDGRHGIRIVNRKDKTITVKANYYVQTAARKSDYGIDNKLDGYSSGMIDILNEEINEAFNSANMVINDGEFKGYSVKFDLQFFDGGTVENAENLAQSDMYEHNGQSCNIGNSYSRWDESDPKFREKTNGDKYSTVGGYVRTNQFLTMNKSNEGRAR